MAGVRPRGNQRAKTTPDTAHPDRSPAPDDTNGARFPCHSSHIDVSIDLTGAEVVATWRPPKLPDTELALQVELTFVALRVAQLRRVASVLRSGRSVMADWAFLKQHIFAATTLDPHDAARVDETVRLWAPTLPTPDLLIGLSASATVLADRVRARGPPDGSRPDQQPARRAVGRVRRRIHPVARGAAAPAYRHVRRLRRPAPVHARRTARPAPRIAIAAGMGLAALTGNLDPLIPRTLKSLPQRGDARMLTHRITELLPYVI